MAPSAWNSVSSPRGKLEALDPAETKTNYLNGRDSGKWITGVRNYSRLRRRNAFRGIDLIFYGSHGQLEFDYVIAPGASPGRIHFRVRRASFKSASGNLKLTTPSGQMLDLHAPLAYQDTDGGRKTIDCRYQVSSRGEVGFTTATFNHALPLLIDPVLTYLGVVPGTRFWDSGGFPMVTDSNGNFYLGGTSIRPYAVPTTGGTLRPTSPCPHLSVHPFCTEAWVIKVTSNGQVAWGTYFGLTGDTGIETMALDTSGNVVLGGDTYSAEFPCYPRCISFFVSQAHGRLRLRRLSL